MIVQQGQINTTALIVPDLYVQIVPPSVTLLNGVPTNVLGVVGTASWGPVNAPATVSDMASYARLFGAIQPRKYDAGTAVAAAVLQGANNFRVVRVTDGTDTKASIALLDNASTPLTQITFNSKYSGSLGDSCKVTIGAGSAASSFKVTVSQPGFPVEVFDNINGTGAAVWANMAAAINNGNSAVRGPSSLITATAGTSAVAPANGDHLLTGGADGAAGVTASSLIGVDTTPRAGLYALRGTGASVALLADADDHTTWSLQVAYGLSEGTYLIGVGPAGDTIDNAVATKATAGIDSYAFKLLHGDWIYFNDTVNSQLRKISPQGFIAGLLANLSPEQSSLNKPLYGIVGTEMSYASLQYSAAELAQLGEASIDVIANPAPGGNYFAARFGHNTSSNAVTNGDNYTRMTNYIASTINAGMGKYVGRLQNKSERREAKVTLDSFFAGMQGQDMIADFQVQLDDKNNPQPRVALGYQQADVEVQYLSVVEKFLINVQGGQSVQINRTSTAPAA